MKPGVKTVLYTAVITALCCLVLYLFCHKPVQPPVSPTDEQTALISVGYQPLAVKPPHKPPGLPAGVKPVLSGSGIVVLPAVGGAPADTLQVVVSVVEDSSGQPWLGVWVNGNPVHWVEPPRIDWPQHRPSPVSAIAEYAFMPSGGQWGAGAAWEPLHYRGFRAGPAITAALSADWIAASLRISRRLGPLSIGAGIGYRIGAAQGLHAGLSAGLAIDL